MNCDERIGPIGRTRPIGPIRYRFLSDVEGHVNDTLIDLMADLREEETMKMVNELIEAGADPVFILDDARHAMELVGKRFERCEYFIPDLMMAGEILQGITRVVKPHIVQ